MKVTADELRAHVVKWSQQPLHASATWVPKFAYHFTDINNAAAIIAAGELLSRNEAVRRGVMQHDNASSQVIAGTPPTHCDYVRIYFRPRTPTQFHNEGIRPKDKRGLDAHCPVPIFFVFDLVDTMSLPGVVFSNGNMASAGVKFGDGAELFARIPFDLVYHEGPIDNALRARNVIFHRHAEVLAPNVLRLDTVRWIGCRSHAERESLLHLIGAYRAHWETRVSVATERLFFRAGCFVESVTLDSANVVQFGLRIPPGWTVRIRFELRSEQTARTWHWKSDAWSAASLRLTVRDMEPGVMRLYVEDCLAYVARAQPADSPF